jgi:small-conductance mechanosensitive channel
MQSALLSLQDWFQLYKLNIILSIVIFVVYLGLRRLAIPKIERYVEQGALKDQVLVKAITALTLLSGAITLAVILIVWGVDFKGLLAISTSIIALVGAALFASWSILSNVTAFFLLLAHQSYRRGTYVRIIDGDNFIEGYIAEINLFHTRLISENREVIIYPNNLLISRPTFINPKQHAASIGKVREPAEPAVSS